MGVAATIITAMGALFSQGKKNQNAQLTDNGMAGMIYVGGLASVSESIAATIVVAINSIQF